MYCLSPRPVINTHDRWERWPLQTHELLHHGVPQFTQSCSKNPTHPFVLHVQPNTSGTHLQANSTALALRAAGTEVREMIVRAEERHQEDPTAGRVAHRPLPASPASPINSPGRPEENGGDDIVTDHEGEGQDDDDEQLASDVDSADADEGVDGEMQGVETASDDDSGGGEDAVSGSDCDEEMQTIGDDDDEEDDTDEADVEEAANAPGVAEDREGIAQPPGGTGVPKRQRQDTLMAVLGGGARGAVLGKGGPSGKRGSSATAASSGVSTVSAIETEPAKKTRRVTAAGSGKARKTPPKQKKPEKEKRRPAVAGSKENKKLERTKKTKPPPTDKGKANRLRSKKPLQETNV